MSIVDKLMHPASITEDMRKFFLNQNVADFAISAVFGQTFYPVILSIVNNLMLPILGVVFFKMNKDFFTFNLLGEHFEIGNILSNLFIFALSMVILYFAFIAPLNSAIKEQQIKQQEQKQLNQDLFQRAVENIEKLNQKTDRIIEINENNNSKPTAFDF